jgi:hypothetical protein
MGGLSMTEIFIEHRKLSKDVALTWDLAYHLYTRYREGPVAIVVNRPEALYAALRKQWVKIIAKLRKEYSATLDPLRKEAIRLMIEDMELLPFRVNEPGDELDVNYVILTDLTGIKQDNQKYSTIYLIERTDTQNMLQRVSRHGVLVRYQGLETL